jgi:hypothetical protein
MSTSSNVFQPPGERLPQVILIPSCKRGAVVSAFEEDAADSGDFRHSCLHSRELSLPLTAQRNGSPARAERASGAAGVGQR